MQVVKDAASYAIIQNMTLDDIIRAFEDNDHQK